MAIRIEGLFVRKVGFVSRQNRVPLLRELTIINDDEATYHDLTLELSADPPLLDSKIWQIDLLSAGAHLPVTERYIPLNAGLLSALTTRQPAVLTLRLLAGGEELARQHFSLEILPRDEWSGAMPELLAAFVIPHDPAIAAVLQAAAEVLHRAGKTTLPEGYRGQRHCWEQASALWSAICSFNLNEALPATCFEQYGQKILTPGQILAGGEASALDLALLFAAALERAGLHAVVVLQEKQVFAGVWLQPLAFSMVMTEDAAELRQRMEQKELLLFDIRCALLRPASDFSRAIALAAGKITDAAWVLDLHRARMQGIRALAVDMEPVPLPELAVCGAMENAPLLPDFDEMAGSAPETGRLQYWQHQLLDLTTQNRLLHFPVSTKGVRLLCPQAAALGHLLAAGRPVQIVAVLRTAAFEPLLQDDYARAALGRGEVLSSLEKSKLDAALLDLYRQSSRDLDEDGVNTLFVALGFLKWCKAGDLSRSCLAPLILLPVRLERENAAAPITMSLSDDEPRFNQTLLELLRHDFSLSVTGLDGPLPQGESGPDVEEIWNTIRLAVCDRPGFEVLPDLVLGTFSFARYLMWKDLTDHADQLQQNPLIQHLLERKSIPATAQFPGQDVLDQSVDLAGLFAPLPADSSQLAAVVASASGHHFVLDGPPGTGKSQTIANMIAHNLALGRRVLFVAEKMAALKVVYQRLEDAGLADFCLELHSGKTTGKEVLKQLERAWNCRESISEQTWQTEAGKATQLQDQLNQRVRLMHRRWPNGLSLYEAIGRVARDHRPETPQLVWPQGTMHSAEQMSQLRLAAKQLDQNAPFWIQGFAAIERSDWSPGWQDSLLSAARELPVAMDVLEAARSRLIEATRLPLQAGDALRPLLDLAGLLGDAYGMDLAFVFSAGVAAKLQGARQAIDYLKEYQQIEAGLSLPYEPEVVRRINPEHFAEEWADACRQLWFFSFLAKKKVARRLGREAGSEGCADVVADLPAIRQLRHLLAGLDQLEPVLSGFPGWAALASDTAQMAAAIKLGERLRLAIAALARSPEHLPALRSAASLLLVDANELLASGGAVSVAVQHFKTAFSQFCSTSARFNLLTGHEQQPADLVLLRKTAYAVTLQPERLKAWCGWCRVRNEAAALGLQPLVEDLLTRPGERGAHTFEVAYARWFAAEMIQAEPDLRYFSPAEEISEACRQQLTALNQLAARVVRARLSAAVSAKNQAASAAAVLYELQKTRHQTVRQLLQNMGGVIDQLAPCMMMSPLSVAQYLPAELARFDLVIFDEASQIATVNALGAMARGRQVVIVGDPCQLPPRSLSGRAADEDNLDDAPESILQECLAAGIASHSLSWHYRSQNESLFAFANHRYYAGRLLTCPPARAGRAVEWRRVNGVYNRGNQLEAEAMVAETVRYLSDPLRIAAGYSLGLVVLNRIQQSLVSDLLDQARRLHPQIEPFFQQKEPVMVKTIATVQGDERDIILLGMTCGPSAAGAEVMPMNWGLLNQAGGWRGLNVAVTRARRSMLVFTSFDPEMVDLNRSSALAVRDLKHFVEYAQYGPLALAVRPGVSSCFEDAVVAALQQKGWQVVTQIGLSPFRVGSAVVHPDHPGDYLAAVECDSACTAADLCQIQPGLLSGQGWKVLRVWPLNWWKDQAGALEDLHLALQVLLAESRLEMADLPAASINQEESHAAVSELYSGDLWFARPRDGGRDQGGAGKLAGSGL